MIGQDGGEWINNLDQNPVTFVLAVAITLLLLRSRLCCDLAPWFGGPLSPAITARAILPSITRLRSINWLRSKPVGRGDRLS